MGVFFIHSVSDTIFAILFFLYRLQTAWDHRWTADQSLKTADIKNTSSPLKCSTLLLLQ